MEALLSDVSRVFLLELTMIGALTLCGCYVTYTDIHFRQIPNGASWGLVVVGVIGQGLFYVWGAVELAQVGFVLLVGFAVSYVLYIFSPLLEVPYALLAHYDWLVIGSAGSLGLNVGF